MKLYFRISIELVLSICFIALCFFMLKKCDTNKKNTAVSKSDTVLKRDTIIKHDTIPAPYAVEHIIPTVDSVPYTDSAYCRELALKYYAKNIYSDTLFKDSTAVIALKDTVYKNGLCKRALYFKQYKTTMIVTNTIEPVPKLKVFAGIDLSYKLIAPAFMLEYNKYIYKIGFDAVGKVPIFGAYYKIY